MMKMQWSRLFCALLFPILGNAVALKTPLSNRADEIELGLQADDPNLPLSLGGPDSPLFNEPDASDNPPLYDSNPGFTSPNDLVASASLPPTTNEFLEESPAGSRPQVSYLDDRLLQMRLSPKTTN